MKATVRKLFILIAVALGIGLLFALFIPVADATHTGDDFDRPPLAYTKNPTSVGTTFVTLHGFASSANDNTELWYEYGLDDDHLNNSTTRRAVTRARTDIPFRLTGLESGRTYFYRAVVRNDHGTDRGFIFTFRTKVISNDSDNGSHGNGNGNGNGGSTNGRPTVITRAAAGVTQQSALLQGTAITQQSGTIRAWFQWGLTSNLGNTTQVLNFSGRSIDFITNIIGLQPAETYYYRAVAENTSGLNFGDIQTFRTQESSSGSSGGNGQGGNSLAITGTVTNVSSTSAILNGAVRTTASNGTAWFEWGKSPSLGNRTQSLHIATSPTFRSVSGAIFQLEPSTTYYYQTVLQTSSGMSRGQMLTFRTSARVPSGNGSSGNGSGNGVKPPTVSTPILEIRSEVRNNSFPNGTLSAIAAKENHTIEFVIRIKNSGKQTLHDVVMGTDFSALLGFIEASDSATFNEEHRRITWNIDELSPGAEVSRIVRVHIESTDTNEVITQKFIARSGEKTVDTMDTTIIVVENQIVLFIRPDPESPARSAPVRIEISYMNESDAPVKNAVLRMRFPESLVYASSTMVNTTEDGTRRFELGTIESDSKGSINISASIDKDTPRGDQLVFTASLDYQDAFGRDQEPVLAFSNVTVSEDRFGTAMLSNANFIPRSLFGWLGVIFITLLIILLALAIVRRRRQRDEISEEIRPIDHTPGRIQLPRLE